MEFAAQVDRTLIAERETLKEKNEYPSTKYGIFRAGESTEEFIAGPEDDQALLFEVFLTVLVKLSKAGRRQTFIFLSRRDSK